MREPMAETSAGQVLVVVGAGLAAEEYDRPTAYRLCDRIRLLGAQARPLVCTDVWWLNDASLRDRPTVSIGSPDVNALTAYLADKLPTAFAVDGIMMVQLDVERGDNLVACWGTDHARTAAAVDAFVERYLSEFVGTLAETQP